MLEQTKQALLSAWGNLIDQVLALLPQLAVALVVLFVGWMVASSIGKLIVRAVRTFKIDEALTRSGINALLERAGLHSTVSVFLGWLVKWFLFLVFLVAALDVLGLERVNEFLSGVVLTFLPNVIVAVLVLLVATVVSDLVRGIVRGAAASAGISSSGFLSTLASGAVWTFAILVALNELGVASELVQTLFMGIVGALALALGIAFGLGGKEAAEKIIARMSESVTKK